MEFFVFLLSLVLFSKNKQTIYNNVITYLFLQTKRQNFHGKRWCGCGFKPASAIFLMRILVVADVHGDTEKLDAILKESEAMKPDVIVCPGDFTDMYQQNTVFSQADIGEMIVQKLLAHNKNVLCVPGNQDPYEMIAIFDEYGVNIHGRTRKVMSTIFAGWGGAQTPFNTLIEPTPEETKHVLGQFKQKLAGKDFVMVVHNPPKDTKLDLAGGDKHVGSDDIRKFVEEAEPRLLISAHIHESAAIDRLGDTAMFYPGPVFEGKYGIVDIHDDKCECRIFSLKSRTTNPKQQRKNAK
jgi:Icc-related predicted phosphoesterase